MNDATGKRVFLSAGLILILLSSFSPQLFAQSKVTFESLYSFESVSDIQLSLDDQHIAFVTRKGFVEADRSISSIWVMDVDGKNMRRVTDVEQSAGQPRWVDRGSKIAFLTSAKHGRQVFTYDLASSKIVQVTDCPQGVADFVWSPTNNGLAFVSSVYPEDASPAYFQARQKAEKEAKHSGKLYDKLLFRPYNHWDDGTITHVFYQDFDSERIVDVTPGPHHAPTSHLGGNQDIAFSPDGMILAFTMNTDSVKAISTNNDIFIADLDGANRKRVSTSPGCDTDPRFSPDGRYLIYLQMARPMYEADQRDIILINRKSGAIRNLTATFDRTLQQVFWSDDSKRIYFTCPDRGFSALYQVDVASGRLICLLDDVYLGDVNIGRTGKTAYLGMSKVDRPLEVFRVNLKKGQFDALTHFSDDFVQDHALADTEVFWYEGAKQDSVMGFISFPADYNPSKTYPMVMLFHGGPEGAWTGNFSNYGWNIHLMAAQGYIAVKINPHGSNSYGLQFQEDLLGNWGVIDIEDVMKGLDYLLETYSSIDADRVGALGRSYGGFLVNYLNGVTDRFHCFVSVDGILDQVSSYFATDELWFPEMEFKGTPMTNPEIYRRSSPVNHAHNFKTPALIIHGGLDYRVDLSQGIGMFTALQRQGVPSEFLFFPDEPHYFRRLQTWRYTYEVQLDWLARWLKASQ